MKKISFESYVKNRNPDLASQIQDEALVNEILGSIISGIKGAAGAVGGLAKGAAGAVASTLAQGSQAVQQNTQNLNQQNIQQRMPLFDKRKEEEAKSIDATIATQIQQEINKIDKKNKTFNAFKTLFPNEVQDVMRIQNHLEGVVGQAEEDKKLHDNAIGTNRFDADQEEFLKQDRILKTQFQEIMKGNLTANNKPISSNYIQKIISGLIYDKKTHIHFLNQPEAENTGSHGWQRHWISVYDGWIAKLEQVKEILAKYKL